MTVHTSDNELIASALNGHKKALESLIKKYQDWVYNLAITFTGDRDEALDLTQETLIKVVTKLSTFQHKSEFSTWLYRIVKNHFLNTKRGKYETSTTTFDNFGKALDAAPDAPIQASVYEVEEKLLVEEAKISCMKGMLLCLDREQRLIYLLGELFEFTDIIGGEIMDISRENFRTKLHRAKKQLYNFMNNKCGLIHKENPCRCARKTTSFIAAGCVNPTTLQFQENVISKIDEQIDAKVEQFTTDIHQQYRDLYQAHPFLACPEGIESIYALIDSPTVRKTFNFDN